MIFLTLIYNCFIDTVCVYPSVGFCLLLDWSGETNAVYKCRYLDIIKKCPTCLTESKKIIFIIYTKVGSCQR